MIFSSFPFIFLFCPSVLAAILACLRRSIFSQVWLVAASIFFYGYWNWRYVPLILLSCCSTSAGACG
jgi:D-alanyl-lipoteichoic acid acyltransferase DltB (MBOAT superfamily)